MLSTLEDPYSTYYTEEEYLEYLQKANGNYKGIGIVLALPETDGDYVQILKVYEKNPAAQAGVLPGDKLMAVNGESVLGKTLEEIQLLVVGEEGDIVSLQLLRGEEELTIDVTCSTVTVSKVHHALYNQATGYIRIDQFRGECAEDFKEALLDLKEREMRSLVIDLRNNPGGTLESVVEIADLLLDEGLIVTVQDKNGVVEEYTSKRTAGGVPLAILVNENSASASEILAGAVQDNQAGIIVGQQTFGKGTVQTTSQLQTNDGWVKFTTAAYFTPSGKNIDGIGITPDIEVDLAPELKGLPIDLIDQDEDAQLWAALDEIRAQADALEEE